MYFHSVEYEEVVEPHSVSKIRDSNNVIVQTSHLYNTNSDIPVQQKGIAICYSAL